MIQIPRYQYVLAACLATAISACSDGSNTPVGSPGNGNSYQTEQVPGAQRQALTVYKSPTCGCCGEWIGHIEQQGFVATVAHPEDLNTIKRQYQIAPVLQSCHTAVTDAGYVFEGHVPARYMRQFLDNPPADAVGLSVPGMPVGSPGMEVGERFMPYQVLLLKKDGSVEVYAEVASAAQQ